MAILARSRTPIEMRGGLPGDPEQPWPLYRSGCPWILVGCIYLPNGNSATGPQFNYKLRWFERLDTYAAELMKAQVPTALAGDYNVMPTNPCFWSSPAARLFRLTTLAK